MIAAINAFTPIWLAWGVLFLTIEGTAIWLRQTGRIRSNGTLSSLFWRTYAHPVARPVLALGFIVLGLHLFFKIP